MRRLLPIILTGFCIASGLICIFGDSGVLEYARLDTYRRSLAKNVEELRQRNAALADELTALQKSPERALVMARDIGLYRPGDEVVRLEGRSPRTQSYEVGALLRLPRGGTAKNPIFKATGVGISAALAGLSFFLSRASRRKANGGSGR